MSAAPFRPSTADFAATVATRQDVLVTLISEVARNYFELRGAQNQLAVARGNAENQRETLDLTVAKFKAGRATELDTARARAQLDVHAGRHPAAGSRRQTLHPSAGRPHRTAAHRPGIGACPAGPHPGPAAAGQHRQPGRPAAPAAGHPFRRKLPGRRHRAHRRRDRRPLPARHLQRQPRRAGQRSLRACSGTAPTPTPSAPASPGPPWTSAMSSPASRPPTPAPTPNWPPTKRPS